MPKGTLYGVSVGPGDPELMTLKAVRVIRSCPVIAAPRVRTRTLALDIARASVDLSGKQIIYLDFAMGAEKGSRDDVHRQMAREVFAVLDQGQDVALLNLGDATLFGTWSYLEALTRQAGYETETVSGVTSFCASAARLHASLTEMEQPLHIIPGYSEDLEAELKLPGTKVLMKSGRALPQVKAVIDKLGLADKAQMVVNCGLPDERALDHLEVVGDEGYFAIVLVGA